MSNAPAVPAAGRGRYYGFLVFTTLGIVGLAGLGTWQLDRLSQKESLIAERQAMLARPPLDLAHIRGAGAPPAYRRVIVSGRFLHDRELRVGPTTRRGRAGWQVVTPLARAEGGIVLVDRGWVPDDRKDPRRRPERQVAGPVTVIGVVNRVAARGVFAPDNDPARGDWFRIDPPAMARTLGLQHVAPYWIVATRDRKSSVGPIGNDRVAMPPNNHLLYAITWYALAALLAVLAVVYWRRRPPAE